MGWAGSLLASCCCPPLLRPLAEARTPEALAGIKPGPPHPPSGPLCTLPGAGGYVGYATTTRWAGGSGEGEGTPSPGAPRQLIGFDMGGTSTDVSRCVPAPGGLGRPSRRALPPSPPPLLRSLTRQPSPAHAPPELSVRAPHQPAAMLGPMNTCLSRPPRASRSKRLSWTSTQWPRAAAPASSSAQGSSRWVGGRGGGPFIESPKPAAVPQQHGRACGHGAATAPPLLPLVTIAPQVGPESAGAHPGPVCYRKGGHLAITGACPPARCAVPCMPCMLCCAVLAA